MLLKVLLLVVLARLTLVLVAVVAVGTTGTAMGLYRWERGTVAAYGTGGGGERLEPRLFLPERSSEDTSPPLLKV